MWVALFTRARNGGQTKSLVDLFIVPVGCHWSAFRNLLYWIHHLLLSSLLYVDTYGAMYVRMYSMLPFINIIHHANLDCWGLVGQNQDQMAKF